MRGQSGASAAQHRFFLVSSSLESFCAMIKTDCKCCMRPFMPIKFDVCILQGQIQGALYGARALAQGLGPFAFAAMFAAFSRSDSPLPYFPGRPSATCCPLAIVPGSTLSPPAVDSCRPVQMLAWKCLSAPHIGPKAGPGKVLSVLCRSRKLRDKNLFGNCSMHASGTIPGLKRKGHPSCWFTLRSTLLRAHNIQVSGTIA